MSVGAREELDPAASRIVRIQPRAGQATLDLAEIWAHRELLAALAGREIRVRYKQAALGAAWAALQPLGTMAVFSLVFGKLARIPSGDTPYPLLALAGLVPWIYFSNGVSSASQSLVDNRLLLTKVYFPRLVLPLAPLLAGLLDLAVATGLLLVISLASGFRPSATLAVLPAFALLATVGAAAISSWLSALTAYYRDVRFVVPFLLQLGLFATPVAYPSSLVPDGWRPLVGLNPMAGVVEGYRWCLLGTAQPDFRLVAVSVGATVVLLLGGLRFFRRLERRLEDVI